MDGSIVTRGPRWFEKPIRGSSDAEGGGGIGGRHVTRHGPCRSAQTIFALLGDAVTEVWPQLVPAAFAGEAMTAFIAMTASTALAGAVAYLVPDRPNVRKDPASRRAPDAGGAP